MASLCRGLPPPAWAGSAVPQAESPSEKAARRRAREGSCPCRALPFSWRRLLLPRAVYRGHNPSPRQGFGLRQGRGHRAAVWQEPAPAQSWTRRWWTRPPRGPPPGSPRPRIRLGGRDQFTTPPPATISRWTPNRAASFSSGRGQSSRSFPAKRGHPPPAAGRSGRPGPPAPSPPG